MKVTYFDKDWNECKQENATYYRHSLKQENGIWYVKDFFMSGQLQMEGHFIDKKQVVKEGPFSYYDEMGNITSRAFYIENHRHGDYVSFYPSGQVKMKVEYNHGVRIRDYVEYYADGRLKAQGFYHYGKLRGENLRYHPNGELQLAMELDDFGNGTLKAYYDNGDLRVSGDIELGNRQGEWKYYDKGNQLAETKEFYDGDYARKLKKEGMEIPEDLHVLFFEGYNLSETKLQ